MKLVEGHKLERKLGYDICKVCGACLRKSGRWYWAGRYSKTAPPCSNTCDDYSEWLKTTKEAVY